MHQYMKRPFSSEELPILVWAASLRVCGFAGLHVCIYACQHDMHGYIIYASQHDMPG